MIVANIIKKIESFGGTITIVATPAKWGGWNVKASSQIGQYYDVEISAQIVKTLDLRTEQDAIDVFKRRDTDYYCVKPWHDEDDLQSDYHAWSFPRKLKDIDKYMQWAKEMTHLDNREK